MPVDMIYNPHHEPVNGAMDNNLRDIMDVTCHASTYALEDIPPPPLIDDLIIDANKDAQGQLHKNSEVASSQYGVNIFIVGLFLMLAVYLKIIRLTESNRLTFLVVLMLIQVVWMTFYICVNDRKKWASTEKDGHAGARWLRCKSKQIIITMSDYLCDIVFFTGAILTKTTRPILLYPEMYSIPT